MLKPDDGGKARCVRKSGNETRATSTLKDCQVHHFCLPFREDSLPTWPKPSIPPLWPQNIPCRDMTSRTNVREHVTPAQGGSEL